MYRFVAPVFVTLASAAVYTVQVGQSGLSFTPQTISAVQGDTVVFELFPGHNVVEGEFHSPCQTDDDDFCSGPYSDTDSGAKKFVVNVTSDDPVYYFCSVQRHCQFGMVGGINIPASGSETIEAYRQAAANVQQAQTSDQLRGGQLLDDAQIASLDSSASSISASPFASASSASSAASASATSAAASGASASRSASAATASSSAGAAGASSGQASGFAAIVLGIAAWMI